jgi:hypothetical protein
MMIAHTGRDQTVLRFHAVAAGKGSLQILGPIAAPLV